MDQKVQYWRKYRRRNIFAFSEFLSKQFNNDSFICEHSSPSKLLSKCYVNAFLFIREKKVLVFLFNERLGLIFFRAIQYLRYTRKIEREEKRKKAKKKITRKFYEPWFVFRATWDLMSPRSINMWWWKVV